VRWDQTTASATFHGVLIRDNRARTLRHSVSSFSLTAIRLPIGLQIADCLVGNAADQIRKTATMNTDKPGTKAGTRLRNLAPLCSALMGFAITASALAATPLRCVLAIRRAAIDPSRIAGLANLPYTSNGRNSRPRRDPRSPQRRRAGCRYTGDLAFLSVYGRGAPIKAIGGPAPTARTQAILVRQIRRSGPRRLKGKRLPERAAAGANS